MFFNSDFLCLVFPLLPVPLPTRSPNQLRRWMGKELGRWFWIPCSIFAVKVLFPEFWGLPVWFGMCGLQDPVSHPINYGARAKD